MVRIRLLLLLIAIGRLTVAPNPAWAEPTGVLRLPQAIDAALAANPKLRVNEADVEIKDAEAMQAGLRLNPVAQLDVQDVAAGGDRSGWKSGQTTLSLSQIIELGRKRTKRLRSAELARDVATGELMARRRSLVADVSAAFASVLISQERLALADEVVRISQEAVNTVRATVKMGAVSATEEHRASSALARAQADRTSKERDLVRARNSLAATWGPGAPTFSKAEGNLEPLGSPPQLNMLLEQAEAAPELVRYDLELSQRRAALDVETSKAIPNVTITAGARHYADGGDVGAVATIEVPLPLFDRNQGNILAATRDLSRTALEKAAVLAEAQTVLRNTHATLSSAFSQAAILRDRGIPEAKRTYEGARDGYQRGLFRYLEVLDAQRTMFELRSAYLDAVDLYYQSASELVRWAAASADETPIEKE